jgi:pilus assembly protein CpaB
VRRLLAAAAALILAVGGALVLLAYARGADTRAMAGLQSVPVLVVTAPIAAGTHGDQLSNLVTTEQLPAKAAVPGRVQDLAQLAGQVATVDLVPGEQLLASRFAAPSDLRAAGTVAVPAGDQEVTVLLQPERAVGGRLSAGDEVGVFLSLSLPDGSGQTHAVLHHVLVTQVQGATSSSDTAAANSSASGTPSAGLMITLATTAAQAETVVFGVEHGTLWLSLEPHDADTGGTTVLTPGNVYTAVHP